MKIQAILVPHAKYHFTIRAIEPIVKKIKNTHYENYVVLSTDHNLQNEHSFKWMKEAFEKLSFKKMNNNNTIVYYVNNSNINEVIIRANQNINENTLIICNSDFTHYGKSYNNYNHNKIEEKKLIQSLLKLNLAKSEQIMHKMQGGPCGMAAILAFIQICQNKVKIPGKLISHYKSSDIIKQKTDYVSYISIVYFNKTMNGKQTLSGKKFLRGININDPRIKKELKDGPQMIFVGLKTSDNIAVACVGNITQDPNSLRQAVRRDLQSSRLTNRKIDSESTYVYVTFLGKPEKWTTVNKNDFKNCNFQSCKGLTGPIGVNVIFHDGGNSIFIPDVWKENPNWSAEKILQKLTQKAGKKNLNHIKEIQVFNGKTIDLN